VCVDLCEEDAEATVAMISADTSGSRDGYALVGDISREEVCRDIVEKTVAKYGRLDILVNNVGVMGAAGTAETVDMVAWEKSMTINVSTMVMMAKYAIPEMRKNDGTKGWKGSIVNIGSVAGLRGGTPSLLYPTSKGAIVNMSRAMAVHHAGEGIRVNCVCPGMLYTPMMYGGGMSEERREARRQRSLLKTEGNGWDCGAAVRYLAGDEARWVTGTVLTVDAGATASTSIVVGSG